MLGLLGPERALATSRYPRDADWLTLDLANLSHPSEAVRLLDRHPLDAIYCVAGMTDVEVCEGQDELVHWTNARGPAVLAGYARRLAIPFVYFSTEYVFDGRSGPYREEDEPNPINVYGMSKLAGERGVLAAYPEALILRTTVVYGLDARRKNFLYSLTAALGAGRRFRVPEDQISTPTYNQDLVRTAVALVAARASGILHVCGPELLSRFRFAEAAAGYLGLDGRLIDAVPTAQLGQRARRPLSAGLLTNKLRETYPESRLLRLEQALDVCGGQLRESMLLEQQQQTLLRSGV